MGTIARLMPKNEVYDTETLLPIEMATAGSTGYAKIDVPQGLSVMNHRLYRQLRQYRCKVNVTPTVGNEDYFRVYTLANNWFTLGAIKYAYEQFNVSLSDEMARGAKPARWFDFKISPQDPDDDDGNPNYGITQVSTFDGDSFVGQSGDEVNFSTTVTDTSGNQKDFYLFGTPTGAFNIFHEYAKYLRGRGEAIPTTEMNGEVAYDGLVSDADDDEMLAETGDRPPYDWDKASWEYGNMVLRGVIGGHEDGSQNLRTSTGFFNAPLGVVFLQKYTGGALTNMLTSYPEVNVEVAGGSYKGVHAPSLV